MYLNIYIYICSYSYIYVYIFMYSCVCIHYTHSWLTRIPLQHVGSGSMTEPTVVFLDFLRN